MEGNKKNTPITEGGAHGVDADGIVVAVFVEEAGQLARAIAVAAAVAAAVAGDAAGAVVDVAEGCVEETKRI